jgi:ribonucleoside-diphosphate reductase alpha chain
MLTITRKFTTGETPVVDMFQWRTMDAVLKAIDGTETFRQNGVEAPAAWSDRAINIVAEKYLRVVDGTRETSVRQIAHRIAQYLCDQGVAQGVFDAATGDIFYDELMFLILDQRFAFNSPVWFNMGVRKDQKPQSSACFIQGVEDTMESIMALETKEVLLFKQGSGTGSNMSPLRSSYERLAGGGYASGPVSFMKPLDKNAGVTKSGGTTRRAAKMVVMNMDHPDILETRDGTPGFIRCKSFAEQVAHDLYSTGKYSAEFNVPNNVYDLVDFQNANTSVRCTDDFMYAVKTDKEWTTRKITDGGIVHRYRARDLWNEVAQAAWICGDPGVQFHDTTNKWHTCKATGPINASNPCSEYLFLDDTACNLGSWNLLKFWNGSVFDVERFIAANRIAITAMEIIVDASSYPSPEIGQNSHDYRPLGIGYANLGALLMHMGLGYDSDEGRAVTGAITSLMSGVCYWQSSLIASVVGPFPGYEKNRESMMGVMEMHQKASMQVMPLSHAVSSSILEAAQQAWIRALQQGAAHGFRNAQISVLAPTGTISFMMDCDTTGCEPMLDLLTYKKLVGGGLLKMPNRAVPAALRALGYDEATITDMLASIEKTGGLGPKLKPVHRLVFQTAIGVDPVSPEGHLRAMAAIQPHISGAISKTVNMPSTTTVAQIADTYTLAWELGLKCVALFRDGCKLSQPASSKATTKDKAGASTEVDVAPVPVYAGLKWGERKKLPDHRDALTHKATIGDHDMYVHVGFGEGTREPMEIFLTSSKAGSTLQGFMQMASMAISIGLQYGVPLDLFIDKLRAMQFEPRGITRHPKIRIAQSIPDYLARWLELNFRPQDDVDDLQLHVDSQIDVPVDDLPLVKKATGDRHGPPCGRCGSFTQRAGSCYVCNTCGQTTGCG